MSLNVKSVAIDPPIPGQQFCVFSFKALPGVVTQHPSGTLGIAKVRCVWSTMKECEDTIKDLNKHDPQDFHTSFVMPVGKFFHLKSSEPSDGVEELEIGNMSISENESNQIIDHLRTRSIEEENRIKKEIQERAQAIRSSNLKEASVALCDEPTFETKEEEYLATYFKVYGHRESILSDVKLLRTKFYKYTNHLVKLDELRREDPNLINLATEKYKEAIQEGVSHPDFGLWLQSDQTLLETDLVQFLKTFNALGHLSMTRFLVDNKGVTYKETGVKSKRKKLPKV
jgi:hypothetical protein